MTVNPDTGPIAGGQTVQITIPSILGAPVLGLSVLPSVTFGGTAATACTAITVALLVPSYTFTCVTPAHAAGVVDVEAKALLALGVPLFDFTGTGVYTYVAGGPPPPAGAVTVLPNHGPQSGGQSVAITVSGLTGLVGLAGLSGVLPNVTFGSNAATGCDPITVGVGTVSFNCTTPAHAAGPVNVTVLGALVLNSTGANAYTYDPTSGPPVTSGTVTVSPNQGPTTGGQTVTITIPSTPGIVGLSLVPTAIFGGNAATGCSLIQATVGTGTVSFTCITPAHGVGPVNVEVKDVLGLLFDYTGANAYTYVAAPVVGTGPLTVSPNHGPIAGGQTVTITVPSAAGLVGLTLAPSATFGGNAATNCSLVSASAGSTTISFTCVTPAHPLGLVDVHVTDSLGLLNLTGVGAYTYDAGTGPPPPGGNVTVNPNQGPIAGGQTVTITVPSSATIVGLSLAPTVTFGGATATACTAIAATVATGNVSFTCTTPAHSLGFVDVTVTTTLGLVNATGTNAYEYIAGGGVGTTTSATALTSSLNPSTVGQSVTFTATVTGTGGTPTGTVTFKDGTTTLGTGTLAGGVATFTTTALTQGSHPITAMYNGDPTFAVSTSTVLTQVVNAGGGPPPSVSGLVFFPLPRPVRLLDTRDPSVYPACIQPNAHVNASSLTVQARSSCTGIPSSAVAITGNGTVDSRFPGSQSGFVTFYSSGTLPLASNLNYVPNVAVPNAFTVSLASDGTFQAYASATTDLIVDVSGYYAPPSAGGLYFHPLRNPVRLLDTRAGYQACIVPNTPMAPKVPLTVQAASACTGIPSSALALAGNGTVDDRIQNAPPGFVTFYPSGQSLPPTSNLNYVPNQAVPNAFIIGLNNGSLNAYATTGTDLVIDVTGYFDADSTGFTYTALLNPVRLLDTRTGNYAACILTRAPISANTSYNVAAQPNCTGVTSSAKAVLGNGTVVNSATGPAGFVTFYPGGQSLPLASNLNYVEGQVVPNAFIIGVGSDGSFNAYVTTTIDLVIDVSGFFA